MRDVESYSDLDKINFSELVTSSDWSRVYRDRSDDAGNNHGNGKVCYDLKINKDGGYQLSSQKSHDICHHHTTTDHLVIKLKELADSCNINIVVRSQ